MTRLSRYVLPVMLVLVALVASPAGAQQVNTYPGWNGVDTISSFGYPNTSTYGEAITTPAGATNLQIVSFWLNEATGFEYQLFIAPWDNNNYLIPGGLAGAIYLSPIQTIASGGTLTQYTINGINATITPGTIYMFGLTIDNVYNYDAQFGAGSMGGDLFVATAPTTSRGTMTQATDPCSARTGTMRVAPTTVELAARQRGPLTTGAVVALLNLAVQYCWARAW